MFIFELMIVHLSAMIGNGPTVLHKHRSITFTKDIILPPGGSAGGKATDSGANVALSFKDNKNAYRWAADSLCYKPFVRYH